MDGTYLTDSGMAFQMTGDEREIMVFHILLPL